MKIDPHNPPMPERAKLEKALDAAEFAADNAGRLSPEELAEIVEAAKWALHSTPPELDFTYLTTFHPLNQVYFRAGLLACREYMSKRDKRPKTTLSEACASFASRFRPSATFVCGKRGIPAHRDVLQCGTARPFRGSADTRKFHASGRAPNRPRKPRLEMEVERLCEMMQRNTRAFPNHWTELELIKQFCDRETRPLTLEIEDR